VAQDTVSMTLLAQTVNAEYIRTPSKGSQSTERNAEVRNESRTTITFLPARWLSSSGAKFKYGAVVRPASSWSLRSVNVIPENSEITNAYSYLDILHVRVLFKSSQASPFDVDIKGRNLLGFLALGARVSSVPAVRDFFLICYSNSD